MAINALVKIISAFALGVCVFIISNKALVYYFRRKKAYISVTNSGAPLFSVLSKNFALVIPHLIEAVLRIKQVDEVVGYIQDITCGNSEKWSEESIVASGILGASLSFVVAFLVSRSFLFGLIAFIGILIGAFVIAENKKSSAETQIREQIPEALRCMSSCARSGLSLLQTFEYVERETDGSLSRTFGACAMRLKMGESVSEATEILRSFRSIPELKFVCIALSVQHSTGGSLAVILEDARSSVMQELDLLRYLRVQTSQARLSASIVTVMPLILIGLFSLMSPDFMQPFFSSIAGFALLFVAVFMQAVGVLAVRRILDVRGGVS